MIGGNYDDDNVVDGRCDGKCVQDDDVYEDDDTDNVDDDITDDDCDDTDGDDNNAEVVAGFFDWDN